LAMRRYLERVSMSMVGSPTSFTAITQCFVSVGCRRVHRFSHNSPLRFFHPVPGYSGLCCHRGRFMISLATLSLLVGASLGLCFRVHVLVPAIMLALVVVAGAGIAAEARLWRIALDVLVVTMCLQVGYIARKRLQSPQSSLARRPTSRVRQSSVRR